MNYVLLDYISLSERFVDQLKNLDEKSQRQVLRLSKRYNKGKIFALERKDPIIKLAVALKSADRTLLKYREAGISEEIFKATFDDIRIWCENLENRGWKNIGWIQQNHNQFELFKIGRLQFQLYKCKSLHFDYSKLPFSRGSNVVNIHIYPSY